MEAYLGEVRMFAGDYAPQGWALCAGQLLSIADNEALFSLIGTTYGGDGQSSFALPDYRGRIVGHRGTNPQTGTSFSLGQRLGSETVTLSVEQLPPHTHQAVASAGTGQSTSPSNAYWADGAPYSTEAGDTQLAEQAVSSEGGGQAHDNMAPYLVINFIIALQGIYPQQG